MGNRKLIIYQVLTRLFGASFKKDSSNDKEVYSTGKFSNFSKAVLNEIKSFGITHIWFTGIIDHATQTDYSAIGKPADSLSIVKGKAGSPYAIRDYYDVAPDLAENVQERMKEFEQLISRTHQQELKVIIDFVPNHVARTYKSLAKPENITDFGQDDDTSVFFSPTNDFYYFPNEKLQLPHTHEKEQQLFEEFPAKATGNDSFTASPTENDWFETIKLNYGIEYHHGETVENNKQPTPLWFKMKDILVFWIQKGVDGFRCDMAEMVPLSFWNWVIPTIKKQYPKVLFIAEVYHARKLVNYLGENGFDYLYDKTGFYDLGKEILLKNLPVKHLADYLTHSDSYANRLLRFLENHDEVRVASKYFLGNPLHAIPFMAAAIMAHKGAVMIYFGQELGERAENKTTFSGNDGRTSIFDYTTIPSFRSTINNFTPILENQKKLQALYRKMFEIASNSTAIQYGDFIDLTLFNEQNPKYDSKKVLSFIRIDDKEALLFILNFHFKASQVIQLFFPAEVISRIAKGNQQTIIGSEIFNNVQKKWKIETSSILAKGLQISLWANSIYIFQLNTY